MIQHGTIFHHALLQNEFQVCSLVTSWMWRIPWMVPLLLSPCHNLRLQDGKFCRKCLALRMMNTATKKRRSNLFSALWLWIWWRFNEEYSEICKRGIQVFNLIDTYWKKCSTIILYNICTSNVQSPAHCQDHCWRYHHPRRVRNPARRECLCKAPSNSRLQMPVFWLPAVHVSCNSCKFVAGKITKYNNVQFAIINPPPPPPRFFFFFFGGDQKKTIRNNVTLSSLILEDHLTDAESAWRNLLKQWFSVWSGWQPSLFGLLLLLVRP